MFLIGSEYILVVSPANTRGHRDRKKISGVHFFANSSLGGLTNYVIRHQPKYGTVHGQEVGQSR